LQNALYFRSTEIREGEQDAGDPERASEEKLPVR
jgi:hypothetical protein